MNILGQKLRDTGDSTFYGHIEVAGANSELVVQGLVVAEELVQQKKTNISDEERISSLENQAAVLTDRIHVLEQIIARLTTEKMRKKVNNEAFAILFTFI